jgi:hypothetical protein
MGAAAAPYCTEHPGCDVHAAVVSCEQGVGDPRQVVIPAAQEQPTSAEQMLWLVFALQGVTVPVQGALQVQPDSPVQAADVVFELHEVTVPVQGALQMQPAWAPHTVWEVIEVQEVSVPLQGTDQAQPAFEQRVEDW